MSKDPTTVICPITFMGKEPQPNESINALFTNPYDTKMVTDLTHSAMCDSIKAQTKNLESDHFMDWASEVTTASYNASSNSIMSYLVTNITELCYQCLIKFLSSTFTLEAMKGEDNCEPGSYCPSQAELIGGFMRDIDIEKLVTLAITCTNMPTVNQQNFTPQQIYVIVDMCMDSIYAILAAKVFNAFINDHMNVAVQRGSLDRLYELLYVECYGEPEDHNINIPAVDVEYAFCSSILREKMEDILMEFRTALMMVAKTASCMVVNNSDYCDHLSDRNYTTKNFVEGNSYITSHVVGIEEE